jgi:iron-sulfur cluster assembly accessory protein
LEAERATETTMSNGITLTERAREELATRVGSGDRRVRIGVQPGGCAGMKFTLAPDPEARDGDRVFYEDAGLQIVAEAEQSTFLEGLKVSFSDSLMERGFQFDSPQASSRCACGASFSP